MVDLYVTLIIAKRRKFLSVPEKLQEEVKQELYNRGYDTNGDLIINN